MACVVHGLQTIQAFAAWPVEEQVNSLIWTENFLQGTCLGHGEKNQKDTALRR